MMLVVLLVFYIFYLLLMCYYFDRIRWFFRFDKSSYKKETNNGFFKTIMRNDAGLIGEFDTFCILEDVPGYKKILVNLYLPTEGDETTEIDLILIHQIGIFVIESKNYSGYIFGDERYREWIQTLNSKTKNKFYNPIWQNNNHIKYLKKFLNLEPDHLITSIVVFSKRCTLQKIKYNSSNTTVLKRDDLLDFLCKQIVNKPYIYSESRVDEIYNMLKPTTKQSDDVKEKHISTIKNKIK